jgi:hypothetical protein
VEKIHSIEKITIVEYVVWTGARGLGSYFLGQEEEVHKPWHAPPRSGDRDPYTVHIHCKAHGPRIMYTILIPWPMGRGACKCIPWNKIHGYYI